MQEMDIGSDVVYGRRTTRQARLGSASVGGSFYRSRARQRADPRRQATFA
jgi:hypothetical protein